MGSGDVSPIDGTDRSTAVKVSSTRRRTFGRLSACLMTAALVAGVAGVASPAVASAYSTSTRMVLHNVPPEDLLANTRGVCDGSFTVVIRNVGGAAGALRYLDAAQRCGIKALIHFSTTISGGTVYPSRVGALVRAVKNHPALFGYLSVKEPSWVGIRAGEIRSLYQAYRNADPGHPVVALFGDIPHFGSSANPYTTGMANIVMVDWYPVETANGGCARTGSHYITTGPKWFRTKVKATVDRVTPGRPIWVMVQTHKYLAPSCHKKQRPNTDQLNRQVRDALVYAGATGIAFHTFRNVNYNMDQYRDAAMVAQMKAISAAIHAGTF